MAHRYYTGMHAWILINNTAGMLRIRSVMAKYLYILSILHPLMHFKANCIAQCSYAKTVCKRNLQIRECVQTNYYAVSIL